MEDFNTLLEFLDNAKPEVRKIAVQNVLNYSLITENVQHLIHVRPQAIKSLCNLLCDEPTISADAASVLINLSSNSELLELMVQNKVVTRIMSRLTCGPELTPVIELKLALLSNVTSKSNSAILQLLQVEEDSKEFKGMYLSILITLFLQTFKKEVVKHTHWVMAVLTNLSRDPESHDLILEEEDFISELSTSLLGASSVIVRRGATAILRNLSMDIDCRAKIVSKAEKCLLTVLDRLSTGVEENREIRRDDIELLMFLSRSQEGQNFFDLEDGKLKLQAAMEKESCAELKDTLATIVDSLEDVQDATMVSRIEFF